MFGFVGRWRPLLYCVFAFYESNLTYVTVIFILTNKLNHIILFASRLTKRRDENC